MKNRCKILFVSLSLVSSQPEGRNVNGEPSCQCATEYATKFRNKHIKTRNGEDCLLYIDPKTKKETCYHDGFGLGTCRQWDKEFEPKCKNPSTAPDWCEDYWCYVKPECKGKGEFEPEKEGGADSSYWPDVDLVYSYSTCGSASYFSKYNVAISMSASELRKVPEAHVLTVTEAFENGVRELLGDESGSVDHTEGNEEALCQFLDSCECDTCRKIKGQWKDTPVDLRKVSITYVHDERGYFEEESRCLARKVQNAFRQIAQKTYNDPKRVAYMYYGLQENGSIIQWPAIKWCPTTYDSRFRPWYSTAVTGPKDVILTLDNSGSMAGSKWIQLKKGVEKVFLTLTSYDHVAVILFSDVTRAYQHPKGEESDFGTKEYEPARLGPATEERKQAILKWLHDYESDPRGGTDFSIAFAASFKLLAQSQAERKTSGCQSAILFMTDGQDQSGFDVKSLMREQKRLKQNTVIFTYAFGTGASTYLPKQIACAHKGAHHYIPDDGDIGATMAKYYTYFAAGIRSTSARWVTYADAGTGVELMAACLPSYHNRGQGEDRIFTLLGAGCVDINMLIDLDRLRQLPEWPEFEKDVHQRTAKCAKYSLTNKRLNQLREMNESSCEPEDYNGIYIVVGSVVGFIVLCCWYFKVCRPCLKKRRYQRRLNKMKKEKDARDADQNAQQPPTAVGASNDNNTAPQQFQQGSDPNFIPAIHSQGGNPNYQVPQQIPQQQQPIAYAIPLPVGPGSPAGYSLQPNAPPDNTQPVTPVYNAQAAYNYPNAQPIYQDPAPGFKY